MSSAIDDLLVVQLQENIITYSIGGIFYGSYLLANEILSDLNQSIPGIYTVLAIIAAYILLYALIINVHRCCQFDINSYQPTRLTLLPCSFGVIHFERSHVRWSDGQSCRRHCFGTQNPTRIGGDVLRPHSSIRALGSRNRRFLPNECSRTDILCQLSIFDSSVHSSSIFSVMRL